MPKPSKDAPSAAAAWRVHTMCPRVGRVYRDPTGVPATLAGEPPPASSAGWGDMSWTRQR